MKLQPYLIFDGSCAEAFRLYQRVLGGRLEALLTHGESPTAAEVPQEWHDRIMHACLVVGDAVLMGSDSPPEYYERPSGSYVSIGLTDPAEAERIFHALAEGGTVKMPLERTFWAERFAMFVDRFGTPWMINCGLAAAAATPETVTAQQTGR